MRKLWLSVKSDISDTSPTPKKIIDRLMIDFEQLLLHNSLITFIDPHTAETFVNPLNKIYRAETGNVSSDRPTNFNEYNRSSSERFWWFIPPEPPPSCHKGLCCSEGQQLCDWTTTTIWKTDGTSEHRRQLRHVLVQKLHRHQRGSLKQMGRTVSTSQKCRANTAPTGAADPHPPLSRTVLRSCVEKGSEESEPPPAYHDLRPAQSLQQAPEAWTGTSVLKTWTLKLTFPNLPPAHLQCL